MGLLYKGGKSWAVTEGPWTLQGNVANTNAFYVKKNKVSSVT